MNLIPPLLCLVALVIPVESTIFSTLLLVQPIRCKNSHPNVLYNTKYNSHYLTQPYIGKTVYGKSHCNHLKSKSSNSFFFPSYLSLEYRKPKFNFNVKQAPKRPHHQQHCEPCHPIINTLNSNKNNYSNNNIGGTGGNSYKYNSNSKFNSYDDNKFNSNGNTRLLRQQHRQRKQIVMYPPGYRGTAQVSRFIEDEVEPLSSS